MTLVTSDVMRAVAYLLLKPHPVEPWDFLNLEDQPVWAWQIVVLLTEQVGRLQKTAETAKDAASPFKSKSAFPVRILNAIAVLQIH